MQLAWDQAKSEASYRARGFDFEFATLVFEGPVFVVEDRRREYGEPRFVAIGLADDLHLTVVYTDRVDQDAETVRRIISARRASRQERGLYDHAFSQG